MLAVEAFKLAGDPAAFPEQLRELPPWQPKRILQNGGRASAAIGRRMASRAAANVPDAGVAKVEVGDRIRSRASRSRRSPARSRGMHKTQGFGNSAAPAVDEGSRIEPFVLLGGEPATKDILDGVDTTWSRVPGGAEIARIDRRGDRAVQRRRTPPPACPRCWRSAAGWPRCPRIPS